MRKILLFLLISVIPISLILYRFNNDKTQTPLLSQNTKSVVILADKFNPSNLEINQGEEIAFINKDTVSHQIASDNHPTHEKYPEFESKVLSPGESFTFKFEKAGEWSFHDHLNPSLVGSIKVSGSLKVDTSSNKQAIIEDVKAKLASSTPLETWQYFKEKYSKLKQEGGHDAAHLLGSTFYDKEGLESIKNCDSSFYFGCYHGFIEHLIEQDGIQEVNKLIKVCQDALGFPGTLTCYHGIGHGVLSYQKYDMPKTLKQCDSLLSGRDNLYCHNGAFMEYSNEKSTDLKCSSLDIKYQAGCYSYQMLSLYGRDSTRISLECAKLPPGQKDMCLIGLGIQLGHAYYKDPNKLIQACSLAGSGKSKCLEGAEEEYSYQTKKSLF